ncbi:hypothetical protein AAES_48865 [Amazona aestiva]|uniref:Uncharacterized protein n=1 Tax=Amazona aestiva TaxID=12930 RepID=A0A0Q3UTK1_AMAAE|nr:hypothetical protein AAES_48865 [Amazona aestiva]
MYSPPQAEGDNHYTPELILSLCSLAQSISPTGRENQGGNGVSLLRSSAAAHHPFRVLDIPRKAARFSHKFSAAFEAQFIVSQLNQLSGPVAGITCIRRRSSPIPIRTDTWPCGFNCIRNMRSHVSWDGVIEQRQWDPGQDPQHPSFTRNINAIFSGGIVASIAKSLQFTGSCSIDMGVTGLRAQLEQIV